MSSSGIGLGAAEEESCLIREPEPASVGGVDAHGAEDEHGGHGGHGHGGHGGHGQGGHGGHGQGGHGHGAPDAAPRVLAMALALTGGFMVVEALVGWWSGSLALLADAGHMLADTGALVLALLAQLWARRPRTKLRTYGFRRVEVLAAFVNGIALAVTAIVILVEAGQRVLEPPPIAARSMLVVAALGLCVNLGSAWMLSRSGGEGVNVRAALAHVLMDALGSVGALLAGFAALAGFPGADPILAGLIALLVALSGWRVLKETTNILLEGVPAHIELASLERTILSHEGVSGLHDLHVWRISDRFDVLTVHISVAPEADGVGVAASVARALRRAHGIAQVTVQPELRRA